MERRTVPGDILMSDNEDDGFAFGKIVLLVIDLLPIIVAVAVWNFLS